MTGGEFFTSLKNILNYQLFTVNGVPITVSSIFIFLLLITFFIILGILVRRLFTHRVLKKFKIDHGTSYTLSRISQYVVITIGVLVTFNFLGINLSSLTVIFGLLSVGIGFGLQNITSNFISGLIILFERPISVGDRVIVNNIEGDVTEISIRSTVVRTANNISIIVPNSAFVSEDVVNYSHGDPSYRLDIDVGVAYHSKLDDVLKALKEVAEKNMSVMHRPEPEVHLLSFGDSAWNMQLRTWIADVKHHPKVRNELNQAIVRSFRQYNIEIPFPQRDLHMRSTDTPAVDKDRLE